MEKTVKNFIEENKMLTNVETIVLGISGGGDSMALAYFMLTSYPQYQYVIAHVNHSLRKEADAEMALVRDFAEKYNVPFHGIVADVGAIAKEKGLGLEETGRIVRYDFFRSLGCDLILTAHHMDDFAETIIEHLVRGCGLKGLCGILPMENGIGRPFLCVKKEALLKYCFQYHLAFVEDKTNEDKTFLRNKIRHEIMPLLEESNPKMTESLYRLGQIVKEDEAALDDMERRYYEKIAVETTNRVTLEGKKLLSLPLSFQRRLILEAGKYFHHTFDFYAVEKILSLKTGKEFPFGKWGRVLQNGSFFVFSEGEKTFSSLAPISFATCGEYETPYGKILVEKNEQTAVSADCYSFFLSAESLKDGVTLRNRKSGDWVLIKGVGRKKLSDWFIDIKIPREQRDSALLFAKEQQVLLWIGHENFTNEEKSEIKVKFIEKNK